MKRLFTFFLVIFAIIYSNSISQPHWTQQPSGTTNDLYDIEFTSLSNGIAVGEAGTIRKTTNGGSTWFGLSSGTTQSLRSISFINNNTGYIVGDSGVIRRTTNGGSNWFVLSSGFTLNLSSVIAIDQNTAYACGNNGLVIKTVNGGVNWSAQATGSINNLRCIHFINGNTGCVVGDQSTIRRTTNGGTSWSVQSVNITGPLTSVWLVNSTTGFISIADLNVSFYRTVNGGANWSPQFYGSNNTIRSIEFIDDLYGYMSGDLGNYYSTGDGGATWVRTPMNTNAWMYGISFVTFSHGWAAGTFGTIMHTTNGGTAAPEAPTNLIGFPTSPSQIFLSWFDNSNNEHGFKIERSHNNPNNFILVGIVGPNTQNFIDGNNLIYSSKYYYRVYSFNGAGNSPYSNIAEIVLTNITQHGNTIPAEYKLYNNFPNPFNPTTRIRFDLPANSTVNITVYDISGSEVEVLLNSSLNSGSYEVSFNGERFSSGMYLYRITTPSYTETKKMILLK